MTDEERKAKQLASERAAKRAELVEQIRQLDDLAEPPAWAVRLFELIGTSEGEVPPRWNPETGCVAWYPVIAHGFSPLVIHPREARTPAAIHVYLSRWHRALATLHEELACGDVEVPQ